MPSADQRIAVAKDQYGRCDALCKRAQMANCPDLRFDDCEQYCNLLENETVNGQCVETNDQYIACLTNIDADCAYPLNEPIMCLDQVNAVVCCTSH